MNIQVINFETCQDHYLVTKMLKTTANNQIEYEPYHCFKKEERDVYLLISKMEEERLIDWCMEYDLPIDRCVVISNHEMYDFICWVGVNLFDKEVDYEKICQWIMILCEHHPTLNLLEDIRFKVGKIKKEHDYESCVEAILKQNPGLKQDAKVILFVKEKSEFKLNEKEDLKIKLYQYYIKGIVETYDYLIITKLNEDNKE